MVNPAYCHVGAGVARSSNGRNYYILQAAYTSAKSCGEYRPPGGSNPGTGSGTGANTGVSQLIAPVKLATPDTDGRIFHEVASGQSLWAIAIAYQVTIRDLETWNNISKDVPLKVGQKLFIPGSNTEGYATPTPVGMVEVSEAGSDGRIYHIVQPYQALFSIAQAYKVNVDSILALNGIQKDWPLQIGQKLLISTGGDSPAPAGNLSPVQQLTPDADGNYYHTVKSGETLYWIARLYEINLYDLMNWNGLNEASVLRPDQRLVLLVTPPATATATLAPTVAAPAARTVTPPAAGGLTTTLPSPTPDSPARSEGNSNGIGLFGFVLIAMATAGLLLFVFSVKKR
jgi:LysM repeat protein